MYDTILFDLDGTLVNSAEGITEGVRYALESLHFPALPYAVREKFIGPPLRESFQKYCGVDEETAGKLLAAYRVYYAEKGLHQAVPYDGIRELLEKLTKAGKELFVATAKPTVYSRTILEEWKLDGFFKEIIGAGFDKNFETKDKIVALAASMATNEKIVMIGDTVYDVEGARACGLPTVGVLYGFGDREALRQARPEHLVQTVEEIGELLCS
ncbi:MAG: HAD family hydrolase [Ruminococcaceae bacterium]|nr:HAD family hydrolase [Oscillospiraceae bacterium]